MPESNILPILQNLRFLSRIDSESASRRKSEHNMSSLNEGEQTASLVTGWSPKKSPASPPSAGVIPSWTPRLAIAIDVKE